MNEKVTYWVELSDYDIETASAMLETGRYLYVGFMCHQTIEKMLKAYFTFVNSSTPPFSHNLTYLAQKSNLFEQFSEEHKSFLDELEPLNIETRYPTYKELLMKSLTKSKCNEILNRTKILQQWIKQKL